MEQPFSPQDPIREPDETPAPAIPPETASPPGEVSASLSEVESQAEEAHEPLSDAASPADPATLPAPNPAPRASDPSASPPRKRRGRFFLGEVVKAVAFLLSGAILALLLVPNSLVGMVKSDSALQKLALLEQMVKAYYVDTDAIDPERLVDGLSAGYLYGLGDPYSAYLDRETYAAICYANEGGSSGIGVDIIYADDPASLYIVHVMKQSPAEEAGLHPGDRVLAVNGQPVSRETYAERVNAVRGEPGTNVTLTVQQEGQIRDLEIERREFTGTSVYARVIDGIGYIEITGLSAATPEQFRQALEQVQEAGVTGLIFDLRDNSGGLVDAASEMLDILLPKGEIGYAVYNNGRRESLAKSDAGEIDLPMAVLVNGSSASAAEYFASALRDYEKAILVGETTFGKGIMQSTMALGDGTAVRLTVAKFYTKSGTEFHGVGLKPDRAVSLPEGTENRYLLSDEEDTVLSAALDELHQR